jgi:hypothetical protein
MTSSSCQAHTVPKENVDIERLFNLYPGRLESNKKSRRAGGRTGMPLGRNATRGSLYADAEIQYSGVPNYRMGETIL